MFTFSGWSWRYLWQPLKLFPLGYSYGRAACTCSLQTYIKLSPSNNPCWMLIHHIPVVLSYPIQIVPHAAGTIIYWCCILCIFFVYVHSCIVLWIVIHYIMFLVCVVFKYLYGGVSAYLGYLGNFLFNMQMYCPVTSTYTIVLKCFFFLHERRDIPAFSW